MVPQDITRVWLVTLVSACRETRAWAPYLVTVVVLSSSLASPAGGCTRTRGHRPGRNSRPTKVGGSVTCQPESDGSNICIFEAPLSGLPVLLPQRRWQEGSACASWRDRAGSYSKRVHACECSVGSSRQSHAEISWYGYSTSPPGSWPPRSEGVRSAAEKEPLRVLLGLTGYICLSGFGKFVLPVKVADSLSTPLSSSRP